MAYDFERAGFCQVRDSLSFPVLRDPPGRARHGDQNGRGAAGSVTSGTSCSVSHSTRARVHGPPGTVPDQTATDPPGPSSNLCRQKKSNGQ